MSEPEKKDRPYRIGRFRVRGYFGAGVKEGTVTISQRTKESPVILTFRPLRARDEVAVDLAELCSGLLMRQAKAEASQPVRRVKRSLV